MQIEQISQPIEARLPRSPDSTFSAAAYLSLFVTLCLMLVADSLRADEWPQWRGPTRDGVWREPGIVKSFDRPQLPIRWRVAISSGYSGPTVAGGAVYVFDRTVNGRKQAERVHCYEALTGEHVWTHAYDCPYVNVSYQAGPRSAVTIHDGRAYSLGTMGHLHCFDAATGIVHWQRDLNNQYEIRMPEWGIACSPLIEGDLVIVQIGGEGACLVAFDRESGEERWRALDDPASYTSPRIIDQAGQRVLVCWTGTRVVGLDPATGELQWETPLPPKRFIRACAAPVWDGGDRLFVSGFFDGSLMLRLDQQRLAVERIWRRVGPSEKETDGLHTNTAEPFLRGNYVYGVDSYGELRCLDARTGERIWESLEAVPKGRWNTVRFIRHSDADWLFTDQGELIIARLSPSGYQEISRTKLIKPTKPQQPGSRTGVCWSHPAFAYGHVFARNDEELVCASLKVEK